MEKNYITLENVIDLSGKGFSGKGFLLQWKKLQWITFYIKSEKVLYNSRKSFILQWKTLYITVEKVTVERFKYYSEKVTVKKLYFRPTVDKVLYYCGTVLYCSGKELYYSYSGKSVILQWRKVYITRFYITVEKLSGKKWNKFYISMEKFTVERIL